MGNDKELGERIKAREKELEENLIKEIVSKIEPKDRVSFLYKLKCAFWGEERADKQEDILERYDNEEYWKSEE